MDVDVKPCVSVDDKRLIHSVQTAGGPLVNIKPLISTDSKFLLTASERNIKVFGTTTGNLLKEFIHHEAKVIGVMPSGIVDDQYVSCDENGVVCFWDLHNENRNEEIQKFALIRNEKKLKSKVVSFHFCAKLKILFAVHQRDNETQKGYLLKYMFPPLDTIKHSVVSPDVLLGPGQFSVSNSGDYLAHLSPEGLVIYGVGVKLQDCKRRRHLVDTRFLTCLAFHPTQDVIATGDITGRIVLWYEFASATPTKMELHWHMLPVVDLAFSFTGNVLYSGGGESVLVKWQLTEQKRYFLPRLGMRIKFIATDTLNNYVVASLSDNGIAVISSKEFRFEGIIQGLSMNIERSRSFPAGIIYDPRTRAIILNGRMGHVQFYDFHHSSQLYHLDITMNNFYTQERFEVIQNTDVEQVAISQDGHWLATFEYREDLQASSELRLKFWNFAKEDQNWYLNTSIEMPHDKFVNGIMFQPTPAAGQTPLCVSCGDDGKLKIWKENDTSDLYGKKSSWGCSGTGFYRHLPATAICISPDGSLIAAGFGSILTFWLPENCHLKGTLSQPYLTEKIKQIEFGHGEGCGSMVVTRTENWVCSWDLFTCTLYWRVSISSTCLAADPLSSHMAVFSKNCHVFVFEPHSSKLVTWQCNIDTCPAISAAFIPRLQKSDSTASWNEQSALIYINENQTLKTLHVNEDSSIPNDKIDRSMRQLVLETDALPAPTPFSALIAQTRTSYDTEIQTQQSGSAAFGVQLEKSTALIQQVLNEARVYRIDSFAHMTSEFCKQIIPEAVTSKEIQEKEDFVTKIKESENVHLKTKKKVSKRRKSKVKSIADSDFSDLMKVLAI
ncbi:WD repeat-containing protein 75-like [Homarus americanus]|uniref:WD repeat-containing protein 75-like n=1 Tax=Homarus americanus TaxID=6706 RepID=UPI001C47C008|nr:WD repeat-containing protein 75-like [Homarus americanus]